MNRILLIFLTFSGLYLASCTSTTPPPVAVQDIPFPGGSETSLPSLSSDGTQLLLSWVATPTDSGAQFHFARLGEDGTWSSPEQIAEGSNWFVNWADYPALVQNKGSLLAYHLQKSSPGKFSYDILLHALPKGGQIWRNGLPLHRDSTQTEHGFVSAAAYTDSTFLVSWLDGRNTGGGGHDSHDAHSGAMSIRAAEVSCMDRCFGIRSWMPKPVIAARLARRLLPKVRWWSTATDPIGRFETLPSPACWRAWKATRRQATHRPMRTPCSHACAKRASSPSDCATPSYEARVPILTSSAW